MCYIQVTNAHQTTSHGGTLCEKTVLRPKVVGSSTCYFSFRSIQRNIITTSNFASTEFATTNGDRSKELTESFLLVYRYLDFDYDYILPADFDRVIDRSESLAGVSRRWRLVFHAQNAVR